MLQLLCVFCAVLILSIYIDTVVACVSCCVVQLSVSIRRRCWTHRAR